MNDLIPSGHKCIGCPYWTFEKKLSIPMPYCSYLKRFGLPNDLSFKNKMFLEALYGDSLECEFPLVMLADKIKECDINL